MDPVSREARIGAPHLEAPAGSGSTQRDHGDPEGQDGERLDWADMSPDPPAYDPDWTESWGRQEPPDLSTSDARTEEGPPKEEFNWAELSPDPPIWDPNWTESWGRQGQPFAPAPTSKGKKTRRGGRHRQKKQGGDLHPELEGEPTGHRWPAGKSTPKPCAACGAKHPLPGCPQFWAAGRDERRRLADRAKLCGNCLNAGHFARSCVQDSNCKVPGCQGKHHALRH